MGKAERLTDVYPSHIVLLGGIIVILVDSLPYHFLTPGIHQWIGVLCGGEFYGCHEWGPAYNTMEVVMHAQTSEVIPRSIC